jgi:hypothetical protein
MSALMVESISRRETVVRLFMFVDYLSSDAFDVNGCLLQQFWLTWLLCRGEDSDSVETAAIVTHKY